MICRLCLITVNVENKVSLFNGSEVNGESQIAKMIAKYFHFEVTQYDAISTTICQDCCSHLDEFQKFCSYVEEKQSMLHKEFLEVKCDIQLGENELTAPNEESLCYIGDIFEVPTEVQLKSEPQEQNIFEEIALDFVERNESSNDDVPLEELRKRLVKRKGKGNQKQSKTKTAKKVKPLRRSKRVKEPSSSDNDNDNHANVETDVSNANIIETSNSMPNSQKAPHKLKIKQNEQFISPLADEDMDKYIAQHMQLKCDICDMHLENYSQLRPHYRQQHKQRDYIRCCGSRHRKRREIYDHIKWHLDPEYFKCSVCGKLMKSRNCLDIHTMTKHHKQEDLIYSCEYCNKRFPRPSMLNSHTKNTHEAKRTFVCQHCNKSFLFKHALAKHIQSLHDNIFPHICDVCGMKFKFKPSFETHILQHQGIVAPPVQCPECGDWVKNKNRLRLHLTTHNKVDVDCKYCGRVCASLSAMRAHIQYMHRRAASYRCTYCEKCFKTPKNLKEHIATHTGVNLYNCPHCSKEFRSSANMYVHIKRQHTQQWLNSRAQAGEGKVFPKPQEKPQEQPQERPQEHPQERPQEKPQMTS